MTSSGVENDQKMAGYQMRQSLGDQGVDLSPEWKEKDECSKLTTTSLQLIFCKKV